MRDLDTRKLAGGGDPTKAAVSDGVTQAGKTRRTVLAGAGAVGVAGVLAACGGADGSGGGGSPGAASATGAAGGEVKTSEVPVGGGIVVAAKRFVVTQPTPGTFKAFDATCTHQGCEVATVSAGGRSTARATEASTTSPMAPSPAVRRPLRWRPSAPPCPATRSPSPDRCCGEAGVAASPRGATR